VQVELGDARRFDLWFDASEPLAWAQYITIEMPAGRDLIMITVMGLTFRFLKLPDDAEDLLPRCATCGKAITQKRWEGTYRHVTEREGILPRRCYPEDSGSWQVATPRKIAGLVLVDVPTEETSTVPLVETHAGQYAVMPTVIPDAPDV
jgi:hypothetical protein